MLVSLPRNFKLILTYTPNPGGGAPASGVFTFLSTPNAGTTNSNSHPKVTVAASGNISLGNNSGPGGTDVFVYNGQVAAGLLGPNNVNFAFSFTKPSDTITMGGVTPDNIAPLVSGQSSIAFIGGAGGPNGVGTIRGAPEPSTMIALTGLVAGGCGIGYRRRMKAKNAEELTSEAS
ncbi:hypothetical protein NZK35_32850 [Stieleria sp. ICT_E10.1]|nr:hypothetical protein [Stieleria sedimenti]